MQTWAKPARCGLAVALAVMIGWGTCTVAAAPAPGSVNYAQVDLDGTVSCPANPPGGTQWTDVPLSAALTTAGGPGWLSVTLNVVTFQSANPITFQGEHSLFFTRRLP